MNLHTSITTALALSEKPVTASALLFYLRCNGHSSLNNRAMRIAIKEINSLKINCIGSSDKGYYLIKNKEGLDTFRTLIKKQIFGLWATYKNAEVSYAHLQGYGHQTSLIDLAEEMEA
jgi:hypothetical protein